jgi:hypothetical protein
LGIQGGGSSPVEEFGKGSSGEDPRVSSSVVVTIITPVKNSRNAFLVVLLVDGVSVTEKLIVHLNGACEVREDR